MRFRTTLTLMIALAVITQPGLASAQSVEEAEGATKWRRWAGAATGALVLGGVASFTDQAGDQARTGVCDTTSCVVAIGSLIGAGLGFLLGSEWDRRVDKRTREGPTLEYDLSSVRLSASPTLLAEGEPGVFALARDRVFFIDDDLNAEPILEGYAARALTVTMGGDLLLLSSSTDVVGVPLPGPADEAVAVADFGTASLAALGGGAIVASEPGRLRRLELSGSPFAPVLLEDQTVATVGIPAALALSAAGNVLWTLEDSSLVGRNPGNLSETTRLRLPSRATAFTLSGPTAFVAVGDSGAVAVDISDPRAPRVTLRLVGMDFAFDAAALDGRIYVAAGAQGVFVYEVASGQANRLGVIRDLDFAGDLLVRGGRLYILDRSAGSLFRL